MSRRSWADTLFALLVVGCATGEDPVNAAPEPEPTPPPVVAPADPAAMFSVADVAERAVKGVVNVSSEWAVERPPEMDPYWHFYNDPLFRRFFGPLPPPQEQRQRSLGSGVIVDPTGVVLTNAHVVGEAERVQVSLPDRGTYDAEVVGTDPKTDLAVLRMIDPPSDLEALPFGDSEALRLGEVVLAIGNPFGVGQTVTMGIVSATGRSDLGIVDLEDFIQTDAAINPGNSGGPLVNLRGEIVGINTAIASNTGGSIGIGFAVPSAMARPILESILEDGEVERGWLGVAIQDLDPDLARAMGLPADQEGIVVADVQEGSPAEKAGFREGDVILRFAGEAVESATRFRNQVAAMGEAPFEAEVLRDGKTVTVRGRLDLQDDDRDARADAEEEASGRTGLSLSALTDDLRRRARVPEDVEGVVVTAVEPGSAAARLGLRPGDVILEVDRKPATDPKEVERTLRRADGPVLLRVWHQGRTVFLAWGDAS